MNFLLTSFFLLKSFNLLATTDPYHSDMIEHKKKCIENIISKPKKDSSYLLSRALFTIKADDTDYIPKVADAGKIFEENKISYQLMHNGIKVLKDCYYGSWMSDIIYALKGHHEPQEEKVFYEVLKYIPTNSTMIELGSYWGYYSLWFSKNVKGAKQYLIEPDPHNMEIGKKNFELNNKKANFYLGYVKSNEKDKITFSAAKEIYIDSFLEEHNIEHLHILHSDIQGAECNMLMTCKNAMKNKIIDYFFISTHDGPRIHDKCLQILRENDYIIISEHKIHESCSDDGLIVAKSPKVFGPKYIHIKKYSP